MKINSAGFYATVYKHKKPKLITKRKVENLDKTNKKEWWA